MGRLASIGQRFPTGDRHLQYKRLNHPLFHNTAFSLITSTRQNTCAEAYVTDFCWSRSFSIKSKSDAHYTLDKLFHRYGVPTRLISDNAKELTQGKFANKAREAQCPLDMTDPYSPWQNRVEAKIRELKPLTERWMVKTRSPKVLWDQCLELGSKICSSIAHNVYQLKGEVPETVTTGATHNISHLCKFAWYDWVMYNEEKAGFPEDKEVLRQYLGLTDPGVGSTMSYQILRPSGRVVHCQTIRLLTPQEWEDEDHEKLRDEFDSQVKTKLDSPMKEEDLEAVGPKREISAVTPTYEAYANDEEVQLRQANIGDYDPETYDAYVLSQILLSKGDDMSLGTVINRKRDKNGNPIGCHNDGPLHQLGNV